MLLRKPMSCGTLSHIEADIGCPLPCITAIDLQDLILHGKA